MESYKNIQQKLQQFTKKYYTNELIKGAILFVSLGVLYLFGILFVEYFFWLQPISRTFLFGMFVLVELFLLIRFIGFPVFKLIGLQKGISDAHASKIIGDHFPEVNDKLLNILQLKNSHDQSDLVLASIQQKSISLQPIPFAKAINFKANISYLKYAFLPLLIWAFMLFSGLNSELSNSLDRVVDYKTGYTPPAPFSFSLNAKKLSVIQGNPFVLTFNTIGNTIPEDVQIHFNNQQYYIENIGNGTFRYTFSEVNKPINFYVEANGIRSNNYLLEVIFTPTIQDVSMQLRYPKYLEKKTETIKSTGNVTVPEGTSITWKVKTKQTDSLMFLQSNTRTAFVEKEKDVFQYSKRILNPISYKIASSNTNLQDYENLQFSLNTIKDAFPSIVVQSDIDSISSGLAQFAGQISDDYGLRKLELVYYEQDRPDAQQILPISILKTTSQSFYYQFPEGISLIEGIDYALFFRVYDNDGVHGSKKTISKTFQYRQKTTEEITQEVLENQKKSINNLEKTLQKQQIEKQAFEKLQQDLQLKKELRWNDKNNVQKFIKRQNQYQKMMQRQTEKLQENLNEKTEKTPLLQKQQELLKERINELKKYDKQQKLMQEIQKMAEKLNKEELLKKAKELSQQNKQQERSLTRILELTKRFYVEQKTMQIAEKLEVLSKKQEQLSKEETPTLSEQQNIKKKFNDIKTALEELDKDNKQLKEPMELPDTEDEKEDIENNLDNSEKSLKNKESSKAKNSQKKSSKAMKAMSAKMKTSMMEMQGETMDENMDDLRKILENLMTFSFQQEDLMYSFEAISVGHPSFGKQLKKQYVLKTYFEHIDDSLYVLSMRLPSLSTKIKEDVSAAHYNMSESLENFSENSFSNGISNQRYVMTATNSLANYLSNLLNSMKNASMSMKSGKGKSGKPSFSLPDLIEKQKGLGKKMEAGMKKSGGKKDSKGGEKKPGNEGKNGEGKENSSSGKEGSKGKNNGEKTDGDSENMNGELFKIYKEQHLLRQQLQEAIEQINAGKSGNSNAKKVLKSMKSLENDILEKGFNSGTLERMKQITYELLKLDSAAFEQNKDNQRKSESNFESFQQKKIKALQFKKRFFNQTEILNRQSLPLQELYRKKVQEYFSYPKNNL